MATRKYLALTGLTVLGCLLLFHVNLPSTPSVTSISRPRTPFDHDFFSFYEQNGFLLSTTTEVPRNILGAEVRYLINNPICDSVSPEPSKVFILLLITSYVGDLELRQKVRQILPQEVLDQVNIKRLFLLGKPPPRDLQRASKYKDVTFKEITEENGKHKDLLMGDFTESYEHLTYKHLMGLEWAATFCQNAQYVLKQDDDTVIDYFQLVHMLTNPKNKLGEKIISQRAIYGKVLDNQPVEREPTSKWYVPVSAYHDATYPAYVSGWAYVTTVPAIQEILEASKHANYFFIDDAFVTGILRERTSVSLLDMGELFTHYKGQLLCCVSVPMFSRSKDNTPLWCDYLVGPSNDDLELLETFQRHSEYCWTSKQCRRRDDNELLAKKCVITGNMKIQDFSTLQNRGKPKAVIRKQ